MAKKIELPDDIAKAIDYFKNNYCLSNEQLIAFISAPNLISDLDKQHYRILLQFYKHDMWTYLDALRYGYKSSNDTTDEKLKNLYLLHKKSNKLTDRQFASGIKAAVSIIGVNVVLD